MPNEQTNFRHSSPTVSVLRAFLAAAALLAALAGCGSSSPSAPAEDRPAWLRALIAEIESEPVTNPPSAIFSYRYQGALVYFRPERCCDIFSDLYDRSGALICHPDGGITGRGDGRCPDFLSTRSDERVVWQDPRQ